LARSGELEKVMFEQFTEKAIKVVMLAQEEARRAGHNSVGTGELLLGLIAEATGVAAQVLRTAGVKLKEARLEVEKISGRGEGFGNSDLSLNGHAKRVFELSIEEAERLKRKEIAPEHLLLGLLRDGEGTAIRVLQNLRVEPIELRTQVLRRLADLGDENAGKLVSDSREANPGDINRTKAYLELILQILKEPEGSEVQFLKTHPNLIDGLRDALEGVASILALRGDQKGAFYLRELAGECGPNKVGSSEGEEMPVREEQVVPVVIGSSEGEEMPVREEQVVPVVIGSSEGEEMPVREEQVVPAGNVQWATPEATRTFLYQLLRVIFESQANPEVVDSLLRENLDKLNDSFPQALRDWGTNTLSRVGVAQRQDLARRLAALNRLVEQFSEGERDINLEIVLTGCEVLTDVLTRGEDSQEWAANQNALGRIYLERIRGKREENLQRAIQCFRAALEVYTQELFPAQRAEVQENLAKAERGVRLLGEQSQQTGNSQGNEVTLIVSQQGEADYRSISEAIKNGQPGTRILVSPGVYREGLLIDKHLEIMGDGPLAEIIVESADSDCILMRADTAVVRGLTLRCRAGRGKKYFGVDIAQGQLVLEKCDISSDSLACVGIHGAATRPVIRSCQIHDGKASGLLFYDSSAGTVEECDIFGNAKAGVEIKDGSNPVIRRCKIYDGKSSGVLVHSNGQGFVEQCDIFSHVKAGVRITNGGNPVIRRCQILEGETSGVVVEGNGLGTIEDCEILEKACEGAEIRKSGEKKEEDEMRGVKNCIVSAGGEGDYTSIGEAIQNASPGTRIKVRPGLYRESLGIDKYVQIVGDGPVAEIILESWNLPCIQMQTDEAVVRGLTIRNRGGESLDFSFGLIFFQDFGLEDRNKTAVHIPQGHLLLEQCDISSERGECVFVESSEANPIIRQCKIHNGHKSGVAFRANARGTVEDCDIFGIDGVGVWIVQGGNPVIQRCQIHDCQKNGIVFDKNAQGTLDDCDIFNNPTAQVAILHESNPVIRRCKIHNGGMSGLVADWSGLGTIEDCAIFSNAGEGIKIIQSGNPMIRRCQVYDSDENGINSQFNGLGVIEECLIFENAKAGVITAEGGNPTIRRCKINRNGYEAVWATKGGGGSIENCDLTGNTRGVFDIQPGCDVCCNGNIEDED
jgi:parallel beta-helix repeat protein